LPDPKFPNKAMRFAVTRVSRTKLLRHVNHCCAIFAGLPEILCYLSKGK
jgi:hypothetical protein